MTYICHYLLYNHTALYSYCILYCDCIEKLENMVNVCSVQQSAVITVH